MASGEDGPTGQWTGPGVGTEPVDGPTTEGRAHGPETYSSSTRRINQSYDVAYAECGRCRAGVGGLHPSLTGV